MRSSFLLRVAWLLGIVLLPPAHQATAADGFKVDTWTVTDGLPQNTVTGLSQDAQGYLWVATRKGLARFDGLEFHAAGTVDGVDLSTRRLTAIVHDDAGLWVGTYATGLFYLRDGRLEPFGPDKGVPHGTIWDLRRDRRGRVWAATAGGARVLEDGRWQTPLVPDGFDDSVNTVLVDRHDRTWIGTSTRGAIRTDEHGVRAFTRAEGLPVNRVFSLSEDAGGGIWAATPEGVARFDETRQRFVSVDALRGVRAYQLLVARTGHVWIATYGRGLLRVDPAGEVMPVPEIGSDFVLSVAEDRDGAIWVGTVSGGLTRLLGVERELLDEEDGLPNFPVTTVYQSGDGTHWVGTLGGGLVRIANGTTRRLSTRTGLPHDSITSVAGAAPGQVWVGTSGAGALRVADGRVVEHLGPEAVGRLVRTIEHGGRGRHYFSGRGLVRREADGSLRRWTLADGLRSEDLRALYNTKNGLYIGTFGGGLSLLQPDDTIRTWGPDEGLHSPFVTSIHVDETGTVWIGTYGGGLFRLQDGAIAQIGEAQGIEDNVVFDIMEDRSHRLWLTMNQGVSIVDLAAANRVADGTLEILPSTFLGQPEGITGFDGTDGNQPQSWLADDGRIWFATTTGVAIVDPARVGAPGVPPAVHVDHLFVQDQPTPVSDAGMQLEARDLLIAFSAPDLRSAGRLRYQYRLVGYDDEWSPAGAGRTAAFTNLPPGTYRFEVRAQRGRGGPFGQPTSFAFTIAPFYYETTWFLALVGIVLTLAPAVGYKLRLHRLQRREQRLQQLVDARTAALRHEMSERSRADEERVALDERMQQAQRSDGLGVLAGGIAHDFNNLLVGVLGEASLAQAEMAPGSRARSHLQRIERAAIQASELTAQLLAYCGRSRDVRLRVDVGRIVRDTMRMLSPVVGTRVTVDIDLPADLPLVDGDPTQIRQVILNLLTNAADAIGDEPGCIAVRGDVRHVDAEGTDVVPAGRYVRLRVRDDGAGMDATTASRIFDPFFSTKATERGLGLAATHSIVTGHGGSIEVESRPGGGTTFTVCLPASDRHATTRSHLDGSTTVTSDQPMATPSPTSAAVVLLVDDERAVRDVARATLASAGFDVEAVSSGEAALDTYRQGPDRFGLVMLDLTLPGMNGRRVFDALRTVRPTLPILLTSGSPADDVADLVREPLVSFVAKPWRPQDLVAQSRQLLRNASVPS